MRGAKLLAAHAQARSQLGLSLIELLVAITIGAILIFGATQVYVDSRNMYETNESTARLQETARYALSVLEPDVRMSNYWGLVKGAVAVTQGQAAQTATSLAVADDCGGNYAHDLMLNLDGSNNSYARSGALAFACPAFGAGAVATADTLTVRRASTVISASTANTLQICSTRTGGSLISDGSACSAAPVGQVNNLVVHGYYVSRDSVGRAMLPSLHRHTLIAGPIFRDDEIIPGIEDFQVQFGIDPSGISGTATQYVDPGNVPVGAQVVSVRVWLLVRSESAEVGFIDGRTYEYGDRNAETCTTDDLNDTGDAGCAYVPNDNFRRLLVSRTMQLRNAIGT